MFTPFAFIKTTGPAGFAPSDISNLVGWWAAGVNTTVSGATNQVTSWGDITNTIGAFEKQFGTFATYQSSGFGTNNMPFISGSPVFQSTRYTSSFDWPYTTSSTVYVVASMPPADTGAYARFISSQNGYNNGFIWLDTVSGVSMGMDMAVGSNLGTTFTPIVDTPMVIRLTWNGTNNKTKLNTDTEVTTTAGTIASQAANKLCLFNAETTYNYGIGFKIAEMAIYNKVLSVDEQASMSVYINNKYGIAS